MQKSNTIIICITFVLSILTSGINAYSDTVNEEDLTPVIIVALFPRIDDMRNVTKISNTAILMYSFLEPILENNFLYSSMFKLQTSGAYPIQFSHSLIIKQ